MTCVACTSVWSRSRTKDSFLAVTNRSAVRSASRSAIYFVCVHNLSFFSVQWSAYFCIGEFKVVAYSARNGQSRLGRNERDGGLLVRRVTNRFATYGTQFRVNHFVRTILHHCYSGPVEQHSCQPNAPQHVFFFSLIFIIDLLYFLLIILMLDYFWNENLFPA